MSTLIFVKTKGDRYIFESGDEKLKIDKDLFSHQPSSVVFNIHVDKDLIRKPKAVKGKYDGHRIKSDKFVYTANQGFDLGEQIFYYSVKTRTVRHIYIASMNMRGEWAKAPEDALKVNVTSAQGKQNINRLTFSPMTPIEGGYKDYWNFESYWQSGKIFEGIPEEESKRWWRSQMQPKRRYPKGKGKKVLHAKWEDGKELNYIDSRKVVYIPEYKALIKNTPRVKELKKLAKQGNKIVVYDFDGPRKDNGDVLCLKVTKEMLKEKLYDPKFPFGHGYTVASLLAGIDLEDEFFSI